MAQQILLESYGIIAYDIAFIMDNSDIPALVCVSDIKLFSFIKTEKWHHVDSMIFIKCEYSVILFKRATSCRCGTIFDEVYGGCFSAIYALYVIIFVAVAGGIFSAVYDGNFIAVYGGCFCVVYVVHALILAAVYGGISSDVYGGVVIVAYDVIFAAVYGAGIFVAICCGIYARNLGAVSGGVIFVVVYGRGKIVRIRRAGNIWCNNC